MGTSNDLWQQQLPKHMEEASRLMKNFKSAHQPNVDDFDKSTDIHKACCHEYELPFSFDEFIELGKSLRARQAHDTSIKGNHYE